MPRIDRIARAESLVAFDAPYRENGRIIAGMDEVGRGPLAGPVVACCVVMRPDSRILYVDDSKKLSEARREILYDDLMADALQVGIGVVDAEEIDRVNILEATREAMRIAASHVKADLFLIDAVGGLGLAGTEISLIRGDASSYSIAAASIIAKVTRDRKMREMDLLYPVYGFRRNKGYGTAEHISALKIHGPCPLHRRSFIGHFVT